MSQKDIRRKQRDPPENGRNTWVHQNSLSREWGRAITAHHDRQKRKIKHKDKEKMEHKAINLNLFSII